MYCDYHSGSDVTYDMLGMNESVVIDIGFQL